MSRLYALLSLLVAGTSALSAPVSYTGTLVDPNGIAAIEFTQATTSAFTAQSWGYGGTASAPGGTNAAGAVILPGGFDAYFSLFNGWGSSATFLASNDDGTCPPAAPSPDCRDPQLSVASLLAGQYTLVVTQWNNFSFAENYGIGTLGDGFIGLAADFGGRTGNWAADLNATAAPIPEPMSASLTAAGLGVIWLLSARRQRLRKK